MIPRLLANGCKENPTSTECSALEMPVSDRFTTNDDGSVKRCGLAAGKSWVVKDGLAHQHCETVRKWQHGGFAGKTPGGA